MDKLLTPREIADHLGVQLSTIYQWTHQGFIPHVKMGRLLRFKIQDIEKWIGDRSINGRKTIKIDIREFEI
jgi:excisionase family DNA binding protein